MARVVVRERGATSYGSGTLVDVQPDYGLVVTNWHVVRDAAGGIQVVFPDGFRSEAHLLKSDRTWDLAALRIRPPSISPVTIATVAPRPGEPLTIAGYGQGTYRTTTGRCTQYVAPGPNTPYEMVELGAQARQGDSGGPIFNRQGQLAGVLFGAAHGTTSGSYCGRVRWFLASLAPDVPTPPTRQSQQEQIVAVAPPQQRSIRAEPRHLPAESRVMAPGTIAARRSRPVGGPPREQPRPVRSRADAALTGEPITWRQIAGTSLYDQVKTIFAAIGVVTILFQLSRLLSDD